MTLIVLGLYLAILHKVRVETTSPTAFFSPFFFSPSFLSGLFVKLNGFWSFHSVVNMKEHRRGVGTEQTWKHSQLEFASSILAFRNLGWWTAAREANGLFT